MLASSLEKRLRNLLVIVGTLSVTGVPAYGHVTLNTPNGGEVLEAGSGATIEWRILIQHNQLNWDLWYSTTGLAGPWLEIATDLPPGSPVAGSIHTYDWTVPDDPSAQVRVRVRMDNAATDYFDESDGDLTIEASISPAIPTVSSWGMAAMTLLVLTAGTLIIRRTRTSVWQAAMQNSE